MNVENQQLKRGLRTVKLYNKITEWLQFEVLRGIIFRNNAPDKKKTQVSLPGQQ